MSTLSGVRARCDAFISLRGASPYEVTGAAASEGERKRAENLEYEAPLSHAVVRFGRVPPKAKREAAAELSLTQAGVR